MKLQNAFSQDTRNLFLYEYSCFNCSRSDRGLEGHHIVGRSSNSPLNFYLICTYCHSHANHSQEEESKYLQTTLRFLLREQYELTKKDIDFYQQHKHLYSL
jgi:hypothetical protein